MMTTDWSTVVDPCTDDCRALVLDGATDAMEGDVLGLVMSSRPESSRFHILWFIGLFAVRV